jgi:hypothetical protein
MSMGPGFIVLECGGGGEEAVGVAQEGRAVVWHVGPTQRGRRRIRRVRHGMLHNPHEHEGTMPVRFSGFPGFSECGESLQ